MVRVFLNFESRFSKSFLKTKIKKLIWNLGLGTPWAPLSCVRMGFTISKCRQLDFALNGSTWLVMKFKLCNNGTNLGQVLVIGYLFIRDSFNSNNSVVSESWWWPWERQLLLLLFFFSIFLPFYCESNKFIRILLSVVIRFPWNFACSNQPT